MPLDFGHYILLACVAGMASLVFYVCSVLSAVRKEDLKIKEAKGELQDG